MEKIENLKIGDNVYSLDKDKFVEWEIININPKNSRFFIILNTETGDVRQIHWKKLQYSGYDSEFFSISKIDLIDKYEKENFFIINKLKN